jgi:hypothetical protein
VFSPAYVKGWYFNHNVERIIENFDIADAMKALDLYMNKTTGRGGANTVNVLVAAYKRVKSDPVKEKKIVDYMMSAKHKMAGRALLHLDRKLTLEEEERALRGMASSKYPDSVIYTKQYKPSLKAVKKLPPVMRLNTLETMAANKHLAFNIFENLGDEDEFKALLFGSVLRHRERVENLVNKHKEIKGLGVVATIKVRHKCDNCGDYEVTITSKRMRTKRGIEDSSMKWLTYQRCALCGKSSETSPTVIENDELKDS